MFGTDPDLISLSALKLSYSFDTYTRSTLVRRRVDRPPAAMGSRKVTFKLSILRTIVSRRLSPTSYLCAPFTSHARAERQLAQASAAQDQSAAEDRFSRIFHLCPTIFNSPSINTKSIFCPLLVVPSSETRPEDKLAGRRWRGICQLCPRIGWRSDQLVEPSTQLYGSTACSAFTFVYFGFEHSSILQGRRGSPAHDHLLD